MFIVVRFVSTYNKCEELGKRMRRTMSQMLKWPYCSDSVAQNAPLCPLWWQSLKFPRDTDAEFWRRWFSWGSLCLKLAEDNIMLLGKKTTGGFIWRWDIKHRSKVCQQDLFDLEKLPRKIFSGNTEIKRPIYKTWFEFVFSVLRRIGKQVQ